MNKRILRAFVATGALATACASWGCVADRPSRNGVFNENQYVRKDFLIRSGAGGTDPGWFMKATIVSSTTPNPYAFGGAVFNGGESAISSGPNIGTMPFVRWVITSDKLQLVNMRELSSDPLISAQGSRTPEVVNAWPITNVDLKYEINLDGEITNFFQENQEADWQQRQWVKLSFDKNDMSDVAPLGEGTVAFMAKCGDSNVSTTLVPGSFLVDEANNYMQWTVSITIPVNFTDATCVGAYGDVGQEFLNFGRQDVTMNMMYSFVRADTTSGRWDPTPIAQGGRECTQDSTTGLLSCPKDATAYVPWVMNEKDPIQRKYGLFHQVAMNRDLSTGLLTAQQYVQRLNPHRIYNLYLAPGYPAEYEVIYCGYEPDGFTPATVGVADGSHPRICGDPHTGGIVDQTNQVFAKAAGQSYPPPAGTLQMKIWHSDDLNTFGDHLSKNPKAFGDVRYNFIRFISDIDVGQTFLGVTEPLGDPRTGELLTATINIQNFYVQDFYTARLQFYLETIGGNGGGQTDNPYGIKGNDFAFTPSGSCTVGDLMPLSTVAGAKVGVAGADNTTNGAVQLGHNAISTVFQKMQQYMHKPIPTYGYLGPTDFIPQEDTDFFSAFYKIIPYEIFRDPAANPFVIQEGGTGNYQPGSAQAMLGAMSATAQFNALMSGIDHGLAPLLDANGNTVGNYDPVGPTGPTDAAAFTDQWKRLTTAFTDSRWAIQGVHPGAKMDKAADILSPLTNFEHAGRHCIQSVQNPKPHWESLTEWANDLNLSTWSYTIWHEFGHSLGLDHNFMGSVDRNNWSHWTDKGGNDQVGMYSSSIMEYPATAGDLFFKGGPPAATSPGAHQIMDPQWAGKPGWLPYDVAALSFIYANALTPATAVANNSRGGPCTASSTCSSVSGQWNDSIPWNDKAGWNNGVENPFLWCSDNEVRYSPFCQTFDFGTTPSEIIAHQLDDDEWQYKWRNFRLYHKYWDDAGYAGGRAFFFHDILRFLSAWSFDWSGGELPGIFVKLGIKPPNGSVPETTYYSNLVNSFTNDISVANQLAASFHLAMVEQASGERPFVTKFDPFYGDVLQQGIIVDKNFALQNFTTLYKVDNYDPTQAAGAYLFAASAFDSNYQSIAENAVNQFVGGQYDVFLYDVPLAVQNFAMTTQNPYFGGAGGRVSIRDWIGAKVFGGVEIDPNQQFLDWAHNLAAVWGFGCDALGRNCSSVGVPACTANDLASCTWDPRQPQLNSDDIYHSDAFNEFRGPDDRRYAFAPISDRNQIMLVDRDWNTATYVIVHNWNSDVTFNLDDGSGGNAAYQLELPLKYFLNAYGTYN